MTPDVLQPERVHPVQVSGSEVEALPEEGVVDEGAVVVADLQLVSLQLLVVGGADQHGADPLRQVAHIGLVHGLYALVDVVFARRQDVVVEDDGEVLGVGLGGVPSATADDERGDGLHWELQH